jgi:hypothetical protein
MLLSYIEQKFEFAPETLIQIGSFVSVLPIIRYFSEPMSGEPGTLYQGDYLW